MALRNQPYFPMYVDDFLSDEKLIECSAETVGVYIKLMCLMHKSEPYGTILLKQKFKQTDKQTKNFALQIAKNFAFSVEITERSLDELIEEKVIIFNSDKSALIQKRMVKDAEISEIRSTAGGKGGKKTQSKDKAFAKAKVKANTVIVNEDVIVNEVIVNNDFKKLKSELINALVLHFGFSEMRFANSQKHIMQFVNSQLLNENDIEHFKNQFTNYHEYKKLSKETIHNFIGFIGTPAMRFENSAWNSENWAEKLNKIKSKPTSNFDAIKNAYNNSKNPYENGDTTL